MPDARQPCEVAVIWIDWYAYHLARFQGLLDTPGLAGKVRGIELVGGVGVHQGLNFREPRSAGLPIDTLMPESSWQNAGQFTLTRKLWSHLTALDPSVVLVPGYYTLPALAAALWARLNRRTSVLMTESTADDHVRVGWKETLKSALIRSLFDWAICGGAAHLRYLHQLGFPADRIAHSYDVVDNDYFAARTSALRQTSAASHNLPATYFLYVGRLAPEKNVDGLLAAWQNYRAEGGTWPLVLVGSGPSADSLRQAAALSPYAAEVHFPGHKGYADLPTFYAFAGCFVLPSTREPWGLVVNEAMASGLPVIVSNRCGCAESLVLDGHNGFIFDPSSQQQLKQCLDNVGHMPHEQRKTLGNHAKGLLRNYSPGTFGKEVENITENVNNNGVR